MIVKVGLDLPARRLFDYLPAPAREPPPVGSRVRVTCAGRQRCGVIAAHARKSPLPAARLLRIEESLEGPRLPADLVACIDALARSFFLPQGRLLLRCLPPALRQPRPAASPDLEPAAALAGRLPELPAGLAKRLREILSADAGARPLLISGVPGSGKGELLAAVLARRLAGGGRALLLAPSVAAADRWHERLAASLPQARLLRLHSALKASEFRSNWLAAAAGCAHVVIGARGAVFAPVPDLALIAVADEHDRAHRASAGLRYRVREVAALRARTRPGCQLALLSATPSLEVRHAARAGTLRAVALPRPAGLPAPGFALVDITGRRLFGGVSGEFELLVARMLRAGKKVAVLASRADRGGAIACCGCGRICRCRRCAGPLIEVSGQGQCRHCRLLQARPAVCRGCQGSDFAAMRPASGRLAEALAARISAARILTVGGAAGLAAAGRALAEDSADVLVGGLELAALEPAFGALVLADVDNVLLSFRLTAGTDLLAAVFRLAWRQSGCEILAQTRFPDHHLFEALRSGIHDSYALAELELRRKSGLPPFRRLALISASGSDELKLARFLGKVRQLGQLHCAGDTVIFDPVPGLRPAPSNRAQLQILVSAGNRQSLHRTLAPLLVQLDAAPAARGVRWDVEVDPQN